MKFLITGGCGFLGTNLASSVIDRGYHLSVLDNLSRFGAEENLEWLRNQGDLDFYQHDMKNKDEVEFVIGSVKPDVIFHVAGQVAMTTSLEDPTLDFETNVCGAFNLLEAVRKLHPEARILFSSTNKVYGDLEQYKYEEGESRYRIPAFPNGFPESTQLDFRTPYGCSKGAADQYVLDYSRSYGLKTVVFRHSSIYGGRQFSTYNQGWVGWFVKQAIDSKQGKLAEPFEISGSGKQVRDVLYSSDLVSCYFSALEHIENCSGEAFNIGGGIENSLSLLELFAVLEEMLEIKLDFTKLPARSSDQRFFVADITKANQSFNWYPKVGYREGLQKMIKWVQTISD